MATAILGSEPWAFGSGVRKARVCFQRELVELAIFQNRVGHWSDIGDSGVTEGRVLPVSLLDSGLPAAGSAHPGEVAVERGAVDTELGGDLARRQPRVGQQRPRHLHLVGAESGGTTELRTA